MVTGLSARPAGFLPRSRGVPVTKRTSQPQGTAATARAKGVRMRRWPRGGPRPGRWLVGRLPLAVGLGLTIPTPPRTLCPRPAERLPGRVSAPESEPAAAGAAEGGGRCTRGRELERAVRAGGRLASGLGPRSATAQPPPLRLPEQSAPGGRAPGYKWGGAVGRGGRGRVCRE